jgi:hypothetical protein
MLLNMLICIGQFIAKDLELAHLAVEPLIFISGLKLNRGPIFC